MANSPRTEIYLISINETRGRTEIKKRQSLCNMPGRLYIPVTTVTVAQNPCVKVNELEASCFTFLKFTMTLIMAITTN